jgi:RNA polymerase sigma-70 factor (ECF subfamily)
MTKPDDTNLIHRSMQGDRRAFEVLLARYEKPVFNAAYRMLNDSEDAKDVTQTVFLRAFENMDHFDPNFKFFSWIYRIALNESINYLNKRNRTTELDREPIAETEGPDDAADSDQRSKRIQTALMTIKTEYRTVIVLKHFLECNYVEISQILEIPEKKVKSRLYSGRQMLKIALQESRLN